MKAKIFLAGIFCLLAACADARPGHGGNGLNNAVPNCPQGTTYSAFDGCLGAQTRGSSGTNVNELSSYNGGTPFPTPPPFNIPVRDYPVGYDTSLTLTPAASWTPAANLSCSVNTTSHQVSCNASTATCSPCVISGIDFTDYWILFSGSSTAQWTITNNKFKAGPTINIKDRYMVTAQNAVHINLDYTYNECDGNSGSYGFVGCLTSVTMGNSQVDPRTWNVNYNYIHDVPVRPFVINTTYAFLSINWNYAKTFQQDEWWASNVSIDSTLGQITIGGPFITTGTNLVHGPDTNGQGAQGGCLKYPSVPINTGTPTAIAGAIGAQISGTPGGLGVYNFIGATGNQTNIILDCGNGLHGEINAAGQVTQTVQMLMSYRGNFITYGSSCPGNGTANIALLNTPQAYTTTIDTNVDYNTMVNGVSGAGEGCASKTFSNNNGPSSYTNSANYVNNYLAPFNASAFGGNSTTSCWGNSGGFGFVGSQSGSTLTVTSTTATGGGAKLPIGTYVTQGSTFGYVVDNSLANADGTGTYTMSDSRTQTFSSGGMLNAPLQTNAAGSIPYAVISTGNKNMILSGSAADFVFSDAGMHTSAACHT